MDYKFSNKPAKILVVEDDPTTLKIITKILSSQPGFEVIGATNGKEGLLLAKDTNPDIIISDYSMPVMDGFELCAAVKSDKDLESTIFILLTAISETDKKVQGFDIGVDDYLVKPYNPSELISKIKAFLKIKFLQDELKAEKANLATLNELLERSMFDLANLLLNLLELHIPEATKRGKRAGEIAKWIAEKLELDSQSVKDIEYAALLHEIGKLSIPKDVLLKKSRDLSDKEREMVKQHPVLGQLVLSTAPKMRFPAMIIRHQLENYDGTGFPDRLVEAEIPIGSRILRVIVDFEDLIEEFGGSVQKTIEFMQKGVRSRYQPQIYQLLTEYTSEIPEKLMVDDKIKITIFDLKEGMVLAHDLYTSAGIKLLPKGANIKEYMIEKIISHNSRDPIVGGVYVLKPQSVE
ncbi:MAG TPA: HD domain-containing phosphohydrolase [Ignavibacteria bacterium]